MFFLQQFFKNKSDVGAITPSTRFLASKMCEDINFNKAKCIVEFGAGTGVVTKQIIKKMPKNSILIVFETNFVFFEKLKKDITDSRCLILNESATNIEKHIIFSGYVEANYIISSLPLAVFPEILRKSILKNAIDNLSKEGEFVQFQYSLNALKLLKNRFSYVQLKFTLLNFPPAVIYRCKI